MQDHQNKAKQRNNAELPPVPDKLYFTIGEVGKLCEVKTHVLRYWEQEFEQLSPIKRRGNRRYYQRKDVILVRQIKELLYAQGFTIEGAKAQILRAEEIKDTENTEILVAPQKTEVLQNILADLEDLLLNLEPVQN